jgi:hypothetical protein
MLLHPRLDVGGKHNAIAGLSNSRMAALFAADCRRPGAGGMPEKRSLSAPAAIEAGMD